MKKNLLHKYILLSIFIIHFSSASAQFWQRINTPVGAVKTMVIRNNGDMYIGTQVAGVFRSTNNGNSWTQLDTTGMIYKSVLCVAIDSLGRVFASNKYGVTKFNGVNSWSPINTGMPANPLIFDLIITRSGKFYAAIIGHGVYQYIANTWTAVNTGLTTTNTTCFAEDSLGALYVGTNLGVFKYNGVSWSSFGVGMGNVAVKSMTVSAGDTLFAATPSNILLIPVAGGNWTNVTNNLPVVNKTFLSLTYKNGRLLLSVLNQNPVNSLGDRYSNIYSSINKGATWSLKTAGSYSQTFPFCGKVLANNAGDYFMAQDAGVSRTQNDGLTWLDVNTGIDTYTGMSSRNNGLVITPNGTLFYTNSSNIFRSVNNGQTWKMINVGLQSNNIITLEYQKHSLFAGESHPNSISHLYRSNNNGNSWTLVDTVDHIYSRVKKHPNGTMYGNMGWNNTIETSSDSGKTWSAIPSLNALPNCGWGMSLAFNNAGTIFGGGETPGVIFSTDNAATWDSIPSFWLGNINAISIDANGDLFEGNEYNVGFSLASNNYDSVRMFHNIPQNNGTYNIAVDTIHHTIYVANGINGIYTGSAPWTVNTPFSTLLSGITGDPCCSMITFDSLGYLWAGMCNNFIYRSTQPIQVVTVTSVNGSKKEELIKCYPNPFSTNAVIKLDHEIQNGELNIFDVLGNDVMNVKNINSSEINIERKQLKAGMYFFRITADEKINASGKFIIE